MSIPECIKLGDDATALARELLVWVAELHPEIEPVQTYVKSVHPIYNKEVAALEGEERAAFVRSASAGIKSTREQMLTRKEYFMECLRKMGSK
jgi:hypothetical protein